MLCQKCNKKVATVFISTVVNGKNSQMYLCTDCAKEFHDSMSPDMQIPFPINDILSNMEFNEDTINNLIKDLKEIEDKNVVEGVNGIDNTESSQKNEEKVDFKEKNRQKEQLYYYINHELQTLFAAYNKGEWNRQEKVDITCSVCNTSFEEYKKTGKLGCSKCYSTFEKQLKPILEGIYGYSEHIGKFPKNKCKDTEVIRTVEQLKEQLNIAIQEEEYEQAAKLRDEILQLEANDI